MAKPTSKKLPKSLRKGTLPRPVGDVWAAGIGALAQARKKGGQSFDALVALGTTVADTGGEAARAAVEQVEAAASRVTHTALDLAEGAADGVQSGVEGVVEAVLSRLGVPGRDEVLALREQVEALQARVQSAIEPTSPPPAGADAPPGGPVYEVVPHERGWAVQRAGAERATSVFATKKAALQDARQTARARTGRLVVYKTDGSVGQEIDYAG